MSWRRPNRSGLFAIVQGIALLIFIAPGIRAAIKFRPEIEARA